VLFRSLFNGRVRRQFVDGVHDHHHRGISVQRDNGGHDESAYDGVVIPVGNRFFSPTLSRKSHRHYEDHIRMSGLLNGQRNLWLPCGSSGELSFLFWEVDSSVNTQFGRESALLSVKSLQSSQQMDGLDFKDQFLFKCAEFRIENMVQGI
jgi:hypothetical protein